METSDKAEVLKDTVDLLTDMTADWDVELSGSIGSETKLVGDLQFESIDIVQVILALEERIGRRGLPFEKLFMANGRYVDEVRVGELVDFIHGHLEMASGETEALQRGSE